MSRWYAADAQRLEAEGVSRSDVDRLADAGVLSAGLVARVDAARRSRELHEQLAAASGALWFVLTQHRSPAEAAAHDGERRAARAVGRAAGAVGALLGAVAFAHLRRPARRRVTADAWTVRLAGRAARLDWITSWGLADVLLLMAETPDGEVVQVLLPASEREGLSITGELPLAAMQGTSTVGAVLDGLRVERRRGGARAAQGRVAGRGRAAHRERATCGVRAHPCGAERALAAAAAAALGSRRRGLGASVGRTELVQMRARAYALVDDVRPGEALDERVASCGRAVTKLAQDATSALVAVQAGRAMLLVVARAAVGARGAVRAGAGTDAVDCAQDAAGDLSAG